MSINDSLRSLVQTQKRHDLALSNLSSYQKDDFPKNFCNKQLLKDKEWSPLPVKETVNSNYFIYINLPFLKHEIRWSFPYIFPWRQNFAKEILTPTNLRQKNK